LRAPGAALRRVSGVRCRPGVHACGPWTPGLRCGTARRSAPGERGGVLISLPPGFEPDGRIGPGGQDVDGRDKPGHDRL